MRQLNSGSIVTVEQAHVRAICETRPGRPRRWATLVVIATSAHVFKSLSDERWAGLMAMDLLSKTFADQRSCERSVMILVHRDFETNPISPR